MNYKVLLMGMNRSVIDDFFSNMNSAFICMCTSLRYDDIINHIKYMEPDILVYCLNNELRENISQMVAIKHYSHDKIPLAIVGSPDECDEFVRISINTADLTLIKPLTANSIAERITKFLDAKKMAEEKLMEQARAEAKEKQLMESSRKRILAIDDDTRILKLIKEELHDDYDVSTAINGKVALKFLENKKVDLILLDYMMPDEDGPAVLTKLRNNETTKNLPVVFLTSITEKEKIKKVLNLKPQGYLLKPIEHDKLFTAIRNIIG